MHVDHGTLLGLAGTHAAESPCAISMSLSHERKKICIGVAAASGLLRSAFAAHWLPCDLSLNPSWQTADKHDYQQHAYDLGFAKKAFGLRRP